MQLHEFRAKLSAIRNFAAPAQCPHCGDVMVAPVSSEFVEGGEPSLGMRGLRRVLQHVDSPDVSLKISSRNSFSCVMRIPHS